MKKILLVSVIVIGILVYLGVTVTDFNNSNSQNDDKDPIRITTNKHQYFKNEIVEIEVKNVGNFSVRLADPTGNMKIYNIESGKEIPSNLVQNPIEIIFENGHEFYSQRDLRQYTELKSGVYEIQVKYQLDGNWSYSYQQFEIFE